MSLLNLKAVSFYAVETAARNAEKSGQRREAFHWYLSRGWDDYIAPVVTEAATLNRLNADAAALIRSQPTQKLKPIVEISATRDIKSLRITFFSYNNHKHRLQQWIVPERIVRPGLTWHISDAQASWFACSVKNAKPDV